MRADPAASTVTGWWLCGSHFSQSQCGRLVSAMTPTIGIRSGECSTASWHIIARASPRALSASPSMVTVAGARTSIVSGPVTMACVAMKRRSAPAVTGSAGCGMSGAIRGVVSRSVPTPTRTRYAAGSSARLSHILGPPINVHNESGTGYVRFSDRLCTADVSVTVRRSRLK